MIRKHVRAIAAGFVAALAIIGATGVGVAVAAPVRPATVFYADGWESDDTPDKANTLPSSSAHTFHTLTDTDWFVISADSTGTRFVIETAGSAGLSMDTSIGVFAYGSGGIGARVGGNDDSDVWPSSWSSSMLFVSPGKGNYFVSVAPGANCKPGGYVINWQKGIARRVAGADRYKTAAAVSRTMWPDAGNQGWSVENHTPNGPSFVVLANADSPSDVLAGSSLAGRFGAPVLLTSKLTLPDATAKEIQRLGYLHGIWQEDFEVVIIGSTSSVSSAVQGLVEEIEAVTKVKRLTGPNRYALAAAAASYVPAGVKSASGIAPAGSVPPVFVANGNAPADQVVAGGMSAASGGPLLFTAATFLPAETSASIRAMGERTIVILGGTGSVSTAVQNQLVSLAGTSTLVKRISAPTRYSLASAAATWSITNLPMSADSCTLVSGANLVDALSVGPLGAYTRGPVLLTAPGALSPETKAFLDKYGPRTDPSYCVGGTGTVPDAVFNTFTTHNERMFP